MIKLRTTVYLKSELIKMLKLRSIKTNQSVSAYINQVVTQDLLEEEQDFKDIQKALKEPSIPFAKVLKQLKINNAV